MEHDQSKEKDMQQEIKAAGPSAASSSPAPLPSDGASSERKQVGPIITALVVILILIIAGLYFFATKINQQPAPTDTDTIAAGESTATDTVPEVSNSADDPQSLQNDLDKSTSGLDAQNF
ncbi:MAG: hypothetical protein QOG91_495 [Candidatus Parcubacteria bacterium]|jgi:hypothetical protein|nr:hypothetical protein [Candidatus Parcubacteria bacterium]